MLGSSTMPTYIHVEPINLKKSVELNPAKNIQHKLDRPTAGMSFI